MKKLYFLLSMLLVSIAASAASSQLYLIGNPVGDWNPTIGQELQQTSPGVFTYTAHFTSTQYFAFTEQLGANSGDWSTLNAHRYGPEVKDATPEGATNKMVYGKDASWKLPEGDYVLTIDTNTLNLAVSGNVDTTISNLYIRRASDDYEVVPGMALTPNADNTIWTISNVNFAAGEQFKVGSQDWGFSFTTNDLAMKLDTTYPYEEGGMDNDMAFEASQFNITVTVNTVAKTMYFSQGSEAPEINLYLMGGNVNGANKWGDSAGVGGVQLTRGENGIYTLDFTELGTNFKFNDGSWSGSYNLGGNEGKVQLGTPYKMSNDGASGNIMFADNVETVYNGTVTVNIATLELTVTGTPFVNDNPDWYLMGMNDIMYEFRDDYMFSDTQVAGVFNLKGIVIPDEDEGYGIGTFKIATAGWNQQFGKGENTLDINEDNLSTTLVEVSDKAEVYYELPTGVYTCEWNLNTQTVTFVKTANIESIGADSAAAPAVYYNVHGQKVQNPKGLVIKVQDGKAEKVVL